jgi:hypothetical protein
MNLATTYLAYLGISIALTVWVARTLHRRGRVFLIDAFMGDEKLADSVNDLLVVGFYLLNLGYIALVLKYGTKPTDLAESIEFLSTKVGLVLMILGTMHFANLLVFGGLRRRTRNRAVAGSGAYAPAGMTDYGRLKEAISARTLR